MFNRPLPTNIVNNPLTDTMYFQQDIIGSESPPPPLNDAFLLLNGGNFLLLSGFNLLLL